MFKHHKFFDISNNKGHLSDIDELFSKYKKTKLAISQKLDRDTYILQQISINNNIIDISHINKSNVIILGNIFNDQICKIIYPPYITRIDVYKGYNSSNFIIEEPAFLPINLRYLVLGSINKDNIEYYLTLLQNLPPNLEYLEIQSISNKKVNNGVRTWLIRDAINIETIDFNQYFRDIPDSIKIIKIRNVEKLSIDLSYYTNYNFILNLGELDIKNLIVKNTSNCTSNIKIITSIPEDVATTFKKLKIDEQLDTHYEDELSRQRNAFESIVNKKQDKYIKRVDEESLNRVGTNKAE